MTVVYAHITHEVQAVAMGTRVVNDRHIKTCPALTGQVACVVEDSALVSQEFPRWSLVKVHMIGVCVL